MRVSTEPSVVYELADNFSFMSPNAKFDPRVRNKVWDGKIRLFNANTGLIYVGLLDAIKEFADTRNYDLELDDTFDNDIDNYIIPELTKTPRDYQIEALSYAVKNKRGVLLSPTASGKSLIIYMLVENFSAHKALIVVPTTSLVFQMKTDFEDYAGRSLDIHCITAGVDKLTKDPIVISTWQSIYKMPKSWFAQFGIVIGDEVHGFEAKSLKAIMEKLDDCKYRFGFTGTLTGTATNRMTLEGLFGPVKVVTTTSELQESGHIAQLKIKSIVLKYKDEYRKLVSKMDFHDETDFLNRYEMRNKFLRNLVLSFDKNSLLLFKNIEHGKELYKMIQDKDPDRDVYLIYGGVDAEDREEIRRILDSKSNAILVASYGTFSTGVNVPNLHNVVLGAAYKSRVKVLQSIGRGLRLHSEKDFLTVYDIVDDLKYKVRSNFTLIHFSERLNIYNSEGFDVRIHTVEI
jgi:superfamily II DNA or RNA helicase